MEESGWKRAAAEWMSLERLPCIRPGQGQVTWSWKEFRRLFLVPCCITQANLLAPVTPAIDFFYFFFARCNLEEHFVPHFMKDTTDELILDEGALLVPAKSSRSGVCDVQLCELSASS